MTQFSRMNAWLPDSQMFKVTCEGKWRHWRKWRSMCRRWQANLDITFYQYCSTCLLKFMPKFSECSWFVAVFPKGFLDCTVPSPSNMSRNFCNWICFGEFNLNSFFTLHFIHIIIPVTFQNCLSFLKRFASYLAIVINGRIKLKIMKINGTQLSDEWKRGEWTEANSWFAPWRFLPTQCMRMCTTP